MRLPDAIEKAIREIELEYSRRGGQQAGIPRLHSLRFAIEDFLKSIGWTYEITHEQ